MSERERVRHAIEGPVEEAVKLVDASAAADVETRLSMLINGWGRGLAAGLEELAIAVGDLRRHPGPTAPEPEPELESARQRPPAKSAEPEQEEPEQDEDRSADEEELRRRAVRSREETAELREETPSESDQDRA